LAAACCSSVNRVQALLIFLAPLQAGEAQSAVGLALAARRRSRFLRMYSRM
jgi:hypothetical protein